MKKLLVIILMASATITFADEANYSMSGDGEGNVFILNVENGDVKMCTFGPVHEAERKEDNDYGVTCSMWRKNKEDASNTYIYKTWMGY